MKFRKLLGGGLLAAVLALGGVAGLATRSESKSVSAASSGETIYFTRPSQSYDKAPKAFYYDGADHYVDMTYAFTNNQQNPQKVYKYTFPSGAEGFKFQFFRGNDQNWGVISEWRTDWPANDTTGFYNTKDNYDDNYPMGYWTLGFFTVVFDNNGGTGSMSNKTCYCDASAGNELPDSEFTRENYTFTGWNTERDGSGISYSSSQNINSSTSGATITLYAQWERSVYTLTYQPNGARGSTATQEKDPLSSVLIKNPSEFNILASGGHKFLKWNTQSNGSGMDYYPGDTYSTDDDLELYFIQDWYIYQFSNDNGANWHNLEKTSETPEGYIGQFGSDSFAFTSGDVISLRRFYGAGEKSTIAPTAYEGNIDSSTSTIKFSTSGKLYLKVTNDDNHTLFVEGNSERGIVVSRSGSEYKYACHYDSDTQWEVSGITLLPGDTLKGTYNGGAGYQIYVENTDVYGISSDGAVSAPGVFTVYLKSTDGGYNFNNVYLNMEDAASATLIAQTFNTALTTVCESTVSGGDTAQITTAFGTQSGYYNHLTSACKTLVATGSTTDADILAMRLKYDTIVNKYGTNIAPDYLGRNPNAKPDMQNAIFATIFGNSDNSTPIMLVVIISVVSLTAVGGYIFLKRRKED